LAWFFIAQGIEAHPDLVDLFWCTSCVELARYGARNIRVFGSIVRGDDRATSVTTAGSRRK
jgi:hypothetical protein